MTKTGMEEAFPYGNRLKSASLGTIDFEAYFLVLFRIIFGAPPGA
ncbi:hypothetical protein BH11VER1_BH11VER1_30140 [soil metagenome]